MTESDLERENEPYPSGPGDEGRQANASSSGVSLLARMFSNSSRLLRSVSGRMDDPRLSTSLRIMAARRRRASRIVDTAADASAAIEPGDDAPGDGVPGEDLLASLASPRRSDLLNAVLAHERRLLHSISTTLERTPRGRLRRVLRRARHGIERDVARLHVLLERAQKGPSAPTGPKEPRP